MPRKGQFTPEQHIHMGAQLKKMNNDLTSMITAIGNTYSLNDKSIRQIQKVLKPLSELRSQLDTHAFEDCSDRPVDEVKRYYY